MGDVGSAVIELDIAGVAIGATVATVAIYGFPWLWAPLSAASFFACSVTSRCIMFTGLEPPSPLGAMRTWLQRSLLSS